MGRPKLFLPIEDASLLQRALAAATDSGLATTVVTGRYDAEIRAHLGADDVQFAFNPAWAEGMGGSIASGVRAAPEQSTAYLLLLADQPDVDAAVVARFLAAQRQHPEAILCTAYPEGEGVPALFPLAYRPALVALTAQHGARRLIRQDPNRVSLRFEREFIDIDTWEDYLGYTSG